MTVPNHANLPRPRHQPRLPNITLTPDDFLSLDDSIAEATLGIKQHPQQQQQQQQQPDKSMFEVDLNRRRQKDPRQHENNQHCERSPEMTRGSVSKLYRNSQGLPLASSHVSTLPSGGANDPADDRSILQRYEAAFNEVDDDDDDEAEGGGDDDPANESSRCGRRERYVRTAQILSESGLLEITMKTADLMRRNKLARQELDKLKAETAAFLESVLANPENERFRPGAVLSNQREGTDAARMVVTNPDATSQSQPQLVLSPSLDFCLLNQFGEMSPLSVVEAEAGAGVRDQTEDEAGMGEGADFLLSGKHA